MKKVREKRIESIGKQIDKHEGLIENEKGRLDTTKDYWKKEIDEKFFELYELTNAEISLILDLPDSTTVSPVPINAISLVESE